MPETKYFRETPRIDSAWIRQLLSVPPLREADVIDQALRFANTGRPTVLFMPLIEVSKMHSNLVMERYGAEHSEEHDALCEALAAIVRTKTAPPQSAIDLWQSRASRLLLSPSLEIADGKLRLGYRFRSIESFDTPPDPLIAFTLLLFCDSDKRYGRELCQCNLERCGKFFFPDRTQRNRPRTKFCSPEHYAASHNAAAPDRVRRSRERRKRTQLKRRR
jgi:hypothetical protein